MTFTYETRTAKDGTITYNKTVNLDRDPVTGKRRQTRLSAKSVKELRRQWIDLQSQRQSGTFVDPTKATVREYFTHWLATIEPTIRLASHRRFTEVVNGRVIPKLGNVPLASLSPLHIQDFYAGCLALKLSTSTVSLYHNVVHRALEQAVRWRLIPRNPCDGVDAPREVNPEMQTWTAEQARRFLALAGDDDLAALWLLAIYTGMRRGEILALRWQDIDLDRNQLAVRRTLTRGMDGLTFGEPKSAAGRRSLALPAVCVAALRSRRARQNERRLLAGDAWHATDLVFDRGDGRLIHPNTVQYGYARLIETANAELPKDDPRRLPRIRFHDLRHTAATLMLANGEHPKIVQERLGHSDISMTLGRYSHVSMDMQREAADRLEQLLGS